MTSSVYLPWVSVSTVEVPDVPVCVPDISVYQGDVDPLKFIQAGAHGVIIRAGSITNLTGVLYEDDQFQNNINKFAGELPMGAYWYYRVNHDPIKQAEYFADLLDRNEWDIPPTADVEVNPNADSAYDFGRWLKRFVDRLEELTDWRVMIYTRGYFWNDNVYGDTSHWANGHFLWVARYTTLPKPWGNLYDADKLRPFDWDTWWLWQHSADNPPNYRGPEFGAESSCIDLNRFNGTLAEFYQWCNWNQEPEEPEEPPVVDTCCDKFKAFLDKMRDELNATYENMGWDVE